MRSEGVAVRHCSDDLGLIPSDTAIGDIAAALLTSTAPRSTLPGKTDETRDKLLGAKGPGRARRTVRGPGIRRQHAHRRRRRGGDWLHGGADREVPRLS